MSGIDERIGRELKGLARPVDLRGVADEVSRRKARRRVVRRARVGILAVWVVVGSMAGLYGLVKVFGSREETPLGDRSPNVIGPSPGGTFSPTFTECDASTLEADVNGDAVLDEVIVYWPSETACDPIPEGVHYQARVVISAGTPDAVALEPQDLPECETPVTGCKAFGAPDVDGDGKEEVAIAIAPGGPAAFYELYRFDPGRASGDQALIRFTVEPPGDPWHQEYGFPPGPAVFAAYGSVTHIHWGACFQQEGEHFLVAATALRTGEDPGLYDVHTTVFRVDGTSLEVVMTDQAPVPTDRLENTDQLCGSPLFVRG
ncbi:MAG TPA: hypothetical protein VGR49_00450 [Actinomycetota bacterium]|jgi:hypothetical protein|nr:hypothetical protein [Actinomycetota bacterium]